MGTPVWPADSGIKAIVLDFDKTITVKHTTGAIFQTAMLDDKNIEINFADLDFFRRVAPVICENGKLCIATFADDAEEALLSDEQIIAWNPENRSMNPKVVGKNLHLEELRKVLGLKKNQMVLFDDSNKNIVLAKKKGYAAIDVPEPVRAEDSDAVTGGFNEDAWKTFLVEQAQTKKASGGCTLL
ncbi:uncharacterized protein MONBRDRAFT_5334 [Monosiga brevicollis MX1]|uniref:FCP1 homology domain-containing protein n=1 Tax=Monosiga brevicollis TaxID=81824 RepID=A9UQN5_MONBE|nr:uncharacterized protein MONBRDRAFT_5334 [Monosiga brevicollis MX1]EDQ92630.1 predicted protein [Monosiga brevicollis MX1]|eukprot:XP_001742392.1 hypothetical protein [Monosiga brevicollis MX1]